MKKRLFSVFAAGILLIACAFTLFACGKKPPANPDDKSSVDVFAENAEYKEFYETITKIENALFGSQNASARTANRVYNAAYNGGKSLEGVAAVADGAINKLTADEVAGFKPEIMPEMLSTYKGIFSSTFAMAKQMGDGITRLKGEKSLFGKVMRFDPANDGSNYYYVIEKSGDHIYQIIYSPENVATVVSSSGEPTLRVEQEYFSLADIRYLNDNSFEFATLTVWGDNEQLSFSYGNSAKRIVYGQSNGTELANLCWADGDLITNTKQISSNASEAKCKEMAATFTPLYDYIDKNYVKDVVNRVSVSLTQSDIDEIVAIWAEQAAPDDGENSPWTFVNGVLTNCDFVNTSAEPTETVTIPDGVVMLAADFQVVDSTGTVRKLVIPSSVTQLKKINENNRWVTAAAKEFRPHIVSYDPSASSFPYRFEYVQSSSPLFRTDEKSGTLLVDNKAIYLFDMNKTVYDLSNVELDDSIASWTYASRYLSGVRTLKAKATRIYHETEDGAEDPYTYVYSEDTIYRLFDDTGINLDCLEIHYGKPTKGYREYGSIEKDEYMERERLTLRVYDVYNPGEWDRGGMKYTEIRELKIVTDGYRYIYFDSMFDDRFRNYKSKTVSDLQAIVTGLENKYSARYNAWKNNDENKGITSEYLTFEDFFERDVYANAKTEDERDNLYSTITGYRTAKYLIHFKTKYPDSKRYSVIRKVTVASDIRFFTGEETELSYKDYKANGVGKDIVKTINVDGDYDDVYINEVFTGDLPSSPKIVNVDKRSRFLSLNVSAAHEQSDGYEQSKDKNNEEYVFASPYFIVKLPFTRTTIEKPENFPLLCRYFGSKSYYDKVKATDFFASSDGVRYEFASSDDGASPLISNYWIKYGSVLSGYLDETESVNETLTLPSDCNAMMPSLTIKTKNKLTKIVIPDNYAYFWGMKGLKSKIEEDDAWEFNWRPEYIQDYNGESEPFYDSYKLRYVEVSDNQPLFKIVGYKIYSKDGSVELDRMTSSSSAPTTREPYPYPVVNVDNEFIDNNGFLRYTFENVISIGYNVTGNVSIDLTLFEGLDPTRLQGIFIGEKTTVTSVNLNLNGHQYAEFAFSFGCSKDEFRNKYGDGAYSLFWNDYFKTSVTYDHFATNGYCYVQDVSPEGNFRYIQFIFTDSADSPEYDVRHSGFDMSQPSNPDIPKEDQPELPAVKGTDFKVIRFNEFEWLLTKHPTKAMNYNLGSGEKLTDVIFYFDATQSAFAKLAAVNDVEKFIAWENFAVPSDMTFASFAEANYEYLNPETGARIKFAFGSKGLADQPTEPDPSEPDSNKPDPSLAETPYTAEFKGQTINFKQYVRKGYSGANYCTQITIHAGFDNPITYVNYAMNEKDKIGNVAFYFLNLTKSQFMNLYVESGDDVFGFRKGYFAFELDFSSPTDESESGFVFYDGGYSITFVFALEETQS